MAGWQTIDSAPRDGTVFIGLKGAFVAPTKMGQYYVKWPHEEGGPTFREEWDRIELGAIVPWSPTHWMPLDPPSSEEPLVGESSRDEPKTNASEESAALAARVA